MNRVPMRITMEKWGHRSRSFPLPSALWRIGMAVGLTTFWCNATNFYHVVTHDRVMLRAAPMRESKILRALMRGEILVGVGIETNGFAGVVPPDDVAFWVHGDLVHDNRVAVSKLNVRSGPGINYNIVGELRKGDTLAVRGEWNGWLKVAPPAGCVVWISTNYVRPWTHEFVAVVGQEDTGGNAGKALSSSGARDVEGVRKPAMPREPLFPKVAPASRTQRPVGPDEAIAPKAAHEPSTVPDPLPSILENRPLVPGVVQGRMVTHEGRIRPSGILFWQRPSRYKLVQEDSKGRGATVCYVFGNNEQLRAFEERLIRIHGREYWVQGYRFSFVIPERITIPVQP